MTVARKPVSSNEARREKSTHFTIVTQSSDFQQKIHSIYIVCRSSAYQQAKKYAFHCGLVEPALRPASPFLCIIFCGIATDRVGRRFSYQSQSSPPERCVWLVLGLLCHDATISEAVCVWLCVEA
jgi:hypothetical protein